MVFCVKCYHTESAAELARPLVSSETVVASLQNGWGNGDVLARAYAAEQLVVGVTYNSGTVLDTGRVAHPGVGPTTIGSFTDGATDAADRLAQALSDGGLEVADRGAHSPRDLEEAHPQRRVASDCSAHRPDGGRADRA